MKNWRFSIILSVLAITGYTSFWFYQASQLEKGVKNCLDELVKGLDQGSHLHYDRIEKSGFPFAIKLSIVNPNITQVIAEQSQIRYQLNGKLTSTFTLLGTLKKSQHRGKSVIYLPGVACIADGNVIVDVENELVDNAKITCKPLTITLQDTNTTPSTTSWLGDVEAYAKLKKNGPERRYLKLHATIVGAHVLAPEHSTPPTRALDILNLAGLLLTQKAGTQTYEIKGAFDVPSLSVMQQFSTNPLLLLSQRVPKIAVDISHVDQQDSLVQAHSSGQLFVDEDDNKTVTAHFQIHTKAKHSENFHLAIQEVIDQIQKLVPGLQLPEGVKTLVPKVNEVGDVLTNYDLTARINKSDRSWKIELNDTGASCDHYGIALKGALKSDQQPISGRLELELQHATRLCDDLAAYYNRSLDVLNELRHDKPKLEPLSKTAVEKIHAYLTEISNPAKQAVENRIVEASYAAGQVQIGKLPLDEFCQKTKTLWDKLGLESIPQNPALTEEKNEVLPKES